MPYELDTDTDGIITMHLPSAMLPTVLDAIRNEKTDIYYQIGHAFLILAMAIRLNVSGRKDAQFLWQRFSLASPDYQRDTIRQPV